MRKSEKKIVDCFEIACKCQNCQKEEGVISRGGRGERTGGERGGMTVIALQQDYRSVITGLNRKP